MFPILLSTIPLLIFQVPSTSAPARLIALDHIFQPFTSKTTGVGDHVPPTVPVAAVDVLYQAETLPTVIDMGAWRIHAAPLCVFAVMWILLTPLKNENGPELNTTCLVPPAALSTNLTAFVPPCG